MNPFSNRVWMGEPKIILGVDIGTTSSGISYAYLLRGYVLLNLSFDPPTLWHSQPPTIGRVGDWPGQEAHMDEKKAVSFGADSLSAETEDRAEDEGWVLAKHFKLHLHPSTLTKAHDLRVDPLPGGIPLSTIYRDFFRFLVDHTKEVFRNRVLDGGLVWERLFPTADVVMAHPNGWGFREQDFMRKAAIDAGIISPFDADSHLIFVAEGEASVHYCLHRANLSAQFHPSLSFVVCDAGGSTVDTTAYVVDAVNPCLLMHEVRASSCVQAGGVFVDKGASQYFNKLLSNPVTQLCEDEVSDYVKAATTDFESSAKKAFKNQSSTANIAVGQSRLNIEAAGVKRGRIKVDGSVIQSWFNPLVDQVVQSLYEQMLGTACRYVLLVGGFGENAYLRERIRATFESRNCQVVTLNDSTCKAVSDGAVIWRISCSVIKRAARFHYGIIGSHVFRPSDPLHTGRPVYKEVEGGLWVQGVWFPIVAKGSLFSPEESVAKTFHYIYKSREDIPRTITMQLYAFAPPDVNQPYWAMDLNGNLLPGFEKVCTITAELGNDYSSVGEHRDSQGRTFWSQEYKIRVGFGGTELHSLLEWTQGSKVYRSKTVMIPNSLA
ncbi:uncharacterized protein EI90DRAFT_3158350 [Cantharellus anzutake]|uniref:uncharacterized protein n=1 Tax=Cantharellus anzutake TaxID=1750568 RepID=UPI00190334C0|nr:uncharacterized protein EI90DRAFT_3158350 [Cantharellus anzutake]KAF8319505.1 hypothetical protein EI90DRAFT_3158350 [Cantharellus anzutake]